MKAATAIAEILKREGVEIVFAYPRNNVIEAAAEAGIRPIIVRQERIAVHMADGYTRQHRGTKIGVFACQHGPGAENAYGSVAQANSESIPLLILPQGFGRRVSQVSTNFNSAKIMGMVSKHAEAITLTAEIPIIMRRAFSLLRNGRRRPVVVEVPLDIYTEDVPEPLDYTPVLSTRSAPDPADVERAADILLGAKRLVIYAGGGIHWANAYAALQELAELLAAPVCTSLEGKSTFDETHPLALGTGGGARPQTVQDFLQQSDVIFGVGCSFMATSFGVTMPPGKTIVHATADPNDINNEIRAKTALVGDAELSLRALIDVCRKKLGGQKRDATAVAAEIKSIEAAWMKKWSARLESAETPINPYRVINELQKIVDKNNVIVTHDAGSPRDQLIPFWKATAPHSYMGWGKTTQLGYGLGLAMGAKLAKPEKLCINVWGDAAIGFTGMDIETAVRDRIPILSILFNNSSMAVELAVMPAATEKFRSTDISGKYAELATALGAYAERITDPAEIAGAIKRGIEQTEQGRPVLLEFITRKETTVSKYPL